VQLLESIVKPDEVTNLMHVIETSLAVSQRKLTELELKESPADFLIQPDVSSINTFDFHKAKEGIQIGRDAAERVLAQLEQKLEAFDK